MTSYRINNISEILWKTKYICDKEKAVTLILNIIHISVWWLSRASWSLFIQLITASTYMSVEIIANYLFTQKFCSAG